MTCDMDHKWKISHGNLTIALVFIFVPVKPVRAEKWFWSWAKLLNSMNFWTGAEVNSTRFNRRSSLDVPEMQILTKSMPLGETCMKRPLGRLLSSPRLTVIHIGTGECTVHDSTWSSMVSRIGPPNGPFFGILLSCFGSKSHQPVSWDFWPAQSKKALAWWDRDLRPTSPKTPVRWACWCSSPICMCSWFFTFLYMYIHTYISYTMCIYVCLYTYLDHVYIYTTVDLSIYLSIYLFIYLSIYLSFFLSFLSILFYSDLIWSILLASWAESMLNNHCIKVWALGVILYALCHGRCGEARGKSSSRNRGSLLWWSSGIQVFSWTNLESRFGVDFVCLQRCFLLEDVRS